MALTATLHRLRIALSDADRGVYEALDLRLAQHPSEALRYLYARVLAYALLYEEGIAFSKGLSTTEEPAVWVRAPDGGVRMWIDVGAPSPERLHKASKLAERVAVFTYHDPHRLLREARGKTVHRRDHIEGYALEPTFLDALSEVTDRNASWELVRSGGQLYVTVGGGTFEGRVEPFSFADEGGTR